MSCQVVVQNLMLPDAYHAPTVSRKLSVVPRITRHVRLKLGTPILVIGRRHSPMLRTAMPIAAVHEDCHTLARKHNINPNPTRFQRNQPILPKAKSCPMQQLPQQHLRLSVNPPITKHRTPNGRRGGRRWCDSGGHGGRHGNIDTLCHLVIQRCRQCPWQRHVRAARWWFTPYERIPNGTDPTKAA